MNGADQGEIARLQFLADTVGLDAAADYLTPQARCIHPSAYPFRAESERKSCYREYVAPSDSVECPNTFYV